MTGEDLLHRECTSVYEVCEELSPYPPPCGAVTRNGMAFRIPDAPQPEAQIRAAHIRTAGRPCPAEQERTIGPPRDARERRC